MNNSRDELAVMLADSHLIFTDDAPDLADAILASSWFAALLAAERERCARIADRFDTGHSGIAAAIRAAGKDEETA